MNGKGSKPRPMSVDRKTFGRRFDRTFHGGKGRLRSTMIGIWPPDLYEEMQRLVHDAKGPVEPMFPKEK